jgi:DNA-directed RNA polymerase specialized sigma24 family protein
MPAEPDGFREFVATRSPALLRSAWMLTGDAQLAEDLLQTALARTWPHWARVRAGRPEAYVRRVMVRTQQAWWRRKWRGETPAGDVPEVADSDAYAAAPTHWPACRSGSGRRSCCATTTTCPRRTWPS